MDQDAANLLRQIERARSEIATRKGVLVDALTSAGRLIKILDVLEEDLTTFARKIGSPSPDGSAVGQQTTAGYAIRTLAPAAESREHAPDPVSREEQNIIDAYNTSPTALHWRFQPQPFGVLNGNELQRSAAASPAFGYTETGAYLLMRSLSGRSYVIPKEAILFQDAYYNNEAMGVVFEC